MEQDPDAGTASSLARMRRLIIFTSSICTVSSLAGQWCATPPPTAAEIAFVRDTLSRIDISGARNDGPYCIPMQANVLRQNNGTGGISQTDLNRTLTYVNRAFLDAGIEFFWKGPVNEANNSDYYDYDASGGDNDQVSGLINLFTPASDAINVYFTNSLGGELCGFAYYPSSSPSTNCIVMSGTCALTGSSGTFPHEMGHYLGLFHTFEGTEYGPNHPTAENVARSGPQANCTTGGDLLCGTNADPNGTTDVECNYTGGGTDMHGVPYDPPLENIMSYYPCSSTMADGFTEDQFDRAVQGLIQRMSYLTYSLDAPPQDVPPPSDLQATLQPQGVLLTWTDNATNELGYLIERSAISATEGFIPLSNGSTAADDTDLLNTSIASYTTYYYRVKSVNGDCDTYSNVDSVTTGLIYCRPFYLFFCSSSPIDDVLLVGEGSQIDNADSGCSTDEFGDFTNLYATVYAGGTYSLTVTPPDTTSFVMMYIQAWGDWNQDGDFEDANETLLPSHSEMAPVFNGSITIPAEAIDGATRIRIRVWNQSSGGLVHPCGQRLVGEGEDYTLHVLPLSTTANDGSTVRPMHLSPDPASDVLRVTFTGVIPHTIHLVDIQGHLLRTIAVQGAHSLVLDVRDLPSGMYMIHGTDGRSTSCERFVKD